MPDPSVNVFLIVDCSPRSVKATRWGEATRRPPRTQPAEGLPETGLRTVPRAPWGGCALSPQGRVLLEEQQRDLAGERHTDTKPLSELSHSAGESERPRVQRTAHIRNGDKAQLASRQRSCPKVRDPGPVGGQDKLGGWGMSSTPSVKASNNQPRKNLTF